MIFRGDGTSTEYKKTEKIVESNEIVAEKKNVMACHYCFKEQMSNIWSDLSDSPKNCIGE